jgi:hypothetical protein
MSQVECTCWVPSGALPRATTVQRYQSVELFDGLSVHLHVEDGARYLLELRKVIDGLLVKRGHGRPDHVELYLTVAARENGWDRRTLELVVAGVEDVRRNPYSDGEVANIRDELEVLR